MANFATAFKQGKEGHNVGLSTGIPALDKAINGIQRKQTISIAAAPKVGKTTFADFAYVLSPYLDAIKRGMINDVEWIYYSYEIDRVSKEFKYAAFFFAHDYNIWDFDYEGKTYGMNAEYLMGKMMVGDDDNRKAIIVSDEHEQILKEIYIKRIIPLFGEYNDKGEQIRKGKIRFVEERENPTGLYKELMHHAKLNGEFMEEEYQATDEKGYKILKKRIIGYKPKNPNKFTLILLDHVRRARRERGFTMKDTIDKLFEYTTDIRNWTGYTFFPIIHSNRNLANVERLRFAGEFIFPTSDDCKDSGNPAEESTLFMTLFNPTDEKYNLKKHFGVELEGLPNYRSLHITEARHVECPQHIQLNMFGGVNMFTPLIQ